MIETVGLTRSFGGRAALEPLDLCVPAGGITGLLGPNGSGKSTLLRLLVGLVPRGRGRARVAGVELTGDGTRVRERVAYAPGEVALYGELCGRATLEFLLRGRTRRARARAEELASGLGLPLGRRVRSYSHGMKRQLLVAAALAPEVPLRLLDEPGEGLDPHKRGELLELLAADAAAGTTILVSSHHLGEVESACGRLLFLDRGRLIADESAAALAARAARIVSLTYPASGPGAAATLAALEACGARRTRAAERRGELAVSCELDERDPRAFLAALAACADLPAPLALRHGELSLAELYRDLYGVEAV